MSIYYGKTTQLFPKLRKFVRLANLALCKPWSARILNLLTPEAILLQKRRFGRNCDGGYVLSDEIIPKSDRTVLLSFGIADDISFEEDFVSAYPHVRVFCFDPTISCLPHENKHLLFEAIGLSGEDNPPMKLFTLQTIYDRCQIPKDSTLLLKIDTEGAEWGFLETFEPTKFDIPLIVMEMHFNWKTQSLAEFLFSPFFHFRKFRLIKKLIRDYYVVHFHANNFAYVYYKTFIFPKVSEVTLVKKSYLDRLIKMENESVDRVNCVNRVDHQLPFSR